MQCDLIAIVCVVAFGGVCVVDDVVVANAGVVAVVVEYWNILIETFVAHREPQHNSYVHRFNHHSIR